MLHSEDLFKGFYLFYKKKYNQNTSTSILTNKISEKFLLLIDKRWKIETISYKWLWGYLIYQWSYWEDCNIQSFNKKVNFSFIYGEKAFQRYIYRNVEFDYQMYENNSLLIKYSINETDFFSLFKKITEKNTYQNPHKSIKHNTEEGFNNCILLTTLYDPLDSSCINCNFKYNCKEILKVNYPRIYKSRIHGKTLN